MGIKYPGRQPKQSVLNGAMLGTDGRTYVTGLVKTLKLTAAVASSIIACTANGLYVGTSNDSTGGFGGKLWTATGKPSALTRTAIADSVTSGLLDSAGASIGGGTIADCWGLPDGNLVFCVQGGNGKAYLYYAMYSGGVWTVGANASTYNDKKAVLDIGTKGGTQPTQIRSLHHPSLCVAYVGGTWRLLFAEYNVNTSRTPGGNNDQCRVWQSTDGGRTWSILLEWNTGGGGVSQVRHLHAVVQDPDTGLIYFCIGDDPYSALIRWNGVAAAPPANTAPANFNNYPGWEALYNAAKPDINRFGHLAFTNGFAVALTDRSIGSPTLSEFWPAAAIGRRGRLAATRGPVADLSSGRDPLIYLTLPNGGVLGLSMWDTGNAGATRGFDVFYTPDGLTWVKVGYLPDIGSTGTSTVLCNVFLSFDGEVIVTLLSGSGRLVTGAYGGSLVFNVDTPWNGVAAALS